MVENADHRASLGKIYMAMGIYLLFFAIIVLFSIIFTSTFIGKMTNLGAGSILALISSLMICFGYRLKKKGEDTEANQ